MLTLGQVCDINPRLPKGHGISDDAEVSFVPMAAVNEDSGAIADKQSRRFVQVKKGYTSFADGDVLFAKITPCMENGKAAVAKNLIGGLGFGSTEFHVLRARAEVLAEWIYYFVRRKSFRNEAKNHFTGTAGQQRVPVTFVESAKIPVPPLEEQRHIVDLLSRAEGIVRLRREAQQKAAELIPAIFLDMFGDPATNPRVHPQTKLGGLVGEFRYGTSQKSGASGWPVLRIPNVIGGTLNLEEIKTVALGHSESERLRLVDGDLLFVRTNGNPDYVGRSAVYRSASLAEAGLDGNECVYASYLIRARLSSKAVTPRFIQGYLSTAYGRHQLRERAKTSAGQYNINIEGLSSLPVILPSAELQVRYEEKVAAVESLLIMQSDAAAKAIQNFEALLAQTFSRTA